MDYLYLEGLFVGSLNDLEMDDFERLVKDGKAYRSYEGVGGFLGLAKVRLVRSFAAPSRIKEE